MTSLELKGVRKSFGATPVLDNVDLTLDAREFVAFLGPSGSGKSTLLRIIAGLETADAGEVWLEGRRIDPLPPGDRGVAMVFQHYALYPHMSVRENMAFGLKERGRWIAPGHNSTITDGTGQDWIVYHAADARHSRLNTTADINSRRIMLIDRIRWGEDGWPIIDGPSDEATSGPAP